MAEKSKGSETFIDRCPSCNAKIHTGSRYCSNCGNYLIPSSFYIDDHEKETFWQSSGTYKSPVPIDLDMIDASTSHDVEIDTDFITERNREQEKGKSLLDIHPTITEYIASFLEEAVKGTPSLETLIMLRGKTIEQIANYIDKPDFTLPKEQEISKQDYDQCDRIYEDMTNFLILIDGRKRTQTKGELLQAIFHHLVKLNKNSVISDARMKKLGEAIQGVQQPVTPPYMRLHQAIVKAGAYQLLNNPTRLRLLQTYLTTEKTFSDIQREEGFKDASGVAKNVKQSLAMIFPHLPQEFQQEFGSANEAIRTKSAHHTESSRRRMQQGWDRLRQQAAAAGTSVKVEFSETHKQHISDANFQRWQREREARRSAQSEEQE